MNNIQHEHSDECRYTDDDCIQYCYLELKENSMVLVDANELVFFDELLEKGQDESTDIPINEDLIENESYKMVYGLMLVNTTFMKVEEAMKIATEMGKGNYGFIYIKKDEAIFCQYNAIKFFPELVKTENYIPFASCMKIPVSLKNLDASITLTPIINDRCIWEYMVNRPFLLACRGESIIENLTEENFAEHINMDEMMQAYNVADLVTGVDLLADEKYLDEAIADMENGRVQTLDDAWQEIDNEERGE